MSRSAGIGRDLVGLLAAQVDRAPARRRAGADRRPVVGGDGQPGPGRRPRCWPPPRRGPSPAVATSATTTRNGCRPGSGRCWSGRSTASSTPRWPTCDRPSHGPDRTDPARRSPTPGCPPTRSHAVIDRALTEDLRDGPDVTTLATVPRRSAEPGQHHPPAGRCAGRRPGGHGRLRHGAGSAAEFDQLVPDGGDLVAGEPALVIAGPDGRHPDRGAHRAEPADPSVRDRHRHQGLGGRGRRHRRQDPGHPQDAAGAAGAGEVRRALRRRGEPPDEPGRRRADQGQPRRGGRFGPGGDRGRPGRGSARSRSRSRSTPSISSTRRSRPAPNSILLDNFSTADTVEAVRRARSADRAGCCWRPPAG